MKNVLAKTHRQLQDPIFELSSVRKLFSLLSPRKGQGDFYSLTGSYVRSLRFTTLDATLSLPQRALCPI